MAREGIPLNVIQRQLGYGPDRATLPTSDHRKSPPLIE
jgi:hypothetical protein